MYVPLRIASKHYGVCKQTVMQWACSGTVDFIDLPSGQRRYRIRGSGNTTFAEEKDAETQKANVCYCRVSSQGQKDDLERQVQYMRSKHPGWEIVTDIGSGLNWKRKGLKAVLRRCMQGAVAKVAVAHKDRLSRFGYEILEFVMGECGVALLCDDQDVHRSKETELAEDILSIVTVFSARIHGQRHYKTSAKSDPPAVQGGPCEAQTVDGSVSTDV